MNRLRIVLTLSLVGLVVAAGCKKKQEPALEPATTEAEPAASAAPTSASATLTGSPEDSDFSGSVTITEEAGGGVKIVAHLAGVDTPGLHGFHVHETGECSHDTAGGKHFTSAGGHFNPAGADHACPPTEPRHAGDLGNVTVGADGSAHFEMTTNLLSLSGPNSVVGKAILLHANEDDCKTQPTGNAGDRIACGVVQSP
jgi:Cu-Zn family superoxide dismutase